LKTAVIVQARVSSTRLPGKVLMPLGTHTVIEEVLRRCRAVKEADCVVCAIPDAPEDNDLIAPAKRAGATVWRGSESDVLARYLGAAEFVGAGIVLRVTSDCPLIDPEVCGELLLTRAANHSDYACNNLPPPSFPHGLDCEAFTIEALRKADDAANEPSEREHVTPWLRQQPAVQRSSLRGPGGPAADMRWTLDYPEDYAFFTRLFALLPPPPAIPTWRQVAELLTDRSDIVALNAARRAAR
jgi:spore coat polysaccharide biosynthesis protein SpsF (cytidylyltransferase family)